MCRRNLATREGRSKRKPRMGLRGFRKVAWRKRGTISSAASLAYPVSPRLRQAEESPDVQVRALPVRFAALRATAAATCAPVPAFAERVQSAPAETLGLALEIAAPVRCAAPIDLDRAPRDENTRVARRCCRPRRVREVWPANRPDAARRIRRPDPSASGRRANLHACSHRADSPCPEYSDACAPGPDRLSILPRAADVESGPSPTHRR